MSNHPIPYRVIRSDSRTKEPLAAVLRHLVEEIWTYRSHIRIVFQQQFRAAYTGSKLGVFWNYALPIVPLTVYLLLSRMRVFPHFEGVEGTTFICFGITLWFFFTGCISVPINTIRSRNSEVMKTAFPLGAAIVSSFAKLLFDTLVRGIVLVLVLIGTGDWPNWSSLLLPVILLPATLMFLGAGLLLGLLNVVYNDVGRVVTVLLQYGIFLSGVIFPLPSHGIIATIDSFNPFAVFIAASRNLVFHPSGLVVEPKLLVMIGLAILLFVKACQVFYIMEYRIRGIS